MRFVASLGCFDEQYALAFEVVPYRRMDILHTTTCCIHYRARSQSIDKRCEHCKHDLYVRRLPRPRAGGMLGGSKVALKRAFRLFNRQEHMPQ